MSDAFDAMTTNRHYRAKLDLSSTREQLIQGAGTQFDPEIVEVFLREVVDRFPEVIEEIKQTYLTLP